MAIADPELDNVETQMVRYKPEGLDALCRVTKFTRKELQIMYRGFKQVRSALSRDIARRNDMSPPMEVRQKGISMMRPPVECF